MELEGFIPMGDILGSGVYVLLCKGEVVYVGKSRAMLARITAHKEGWSKMRLRKAPKWITVKGIDFDDVYIYPCPRDMIDELEQATIRYYKPKHNILHNKPEKLHLQSLTIRGITVSLDKPEPKSAEPFERRV